MKHTKGEWKFNDRDIVVGQNIGQQRICTMIKHRDEYQAEDEANVRLITAAPDLLAACELALGLITGERITYDAFPPADHLTLILASQMGKCEKLLKQAITKTKQ